MRSTLLASTVLVSSLLHAQIVINEIDYDQPSTDNAEFIEIYNAGIEPWPLNDVSVVMMNGTSGAAVEYRTVMNATWPDLAPGDYFVICGNMGLTLNCDQQASATGLTNIIQNGPNDAVALVRTSTGDIIDVVSYGGSLAGYVEGTGTNAEDTNDQDGISLCRFPNGADTQDNDADFVQGCSTPGEANLVDPVNCSLQTGMQAHVNGTSFTLLPAVGGERMNLYFEAAASGTVLFSVYTAEGSLVVEHAVTNATKANWSFSTQDHHGQLLLVRAASSTGSVTRRVMVP